jgi:uncharacterized protein (DUF302 family)
MRAAEEELMTIGLWVLAGLVAGAVLTALAVVWLMRTRMVVAGRSNASFDETCERVERVVPAGDGWSFPMPSLDMHAKLAAKGAAPDGVRRIRLFFVCKPALAKRVLSATPKMAAIMPCSWAVYELEDGSVWLAKMNISMMARLFSGPVASAMGEVAAADDAFLAEVLA